MFIRHDEKGREILSDMPAAFNVPTQKRISTLDFHRQRLLEQREMMRRMMEEMREDMEHETFREANDFAVEDPFDETIATHSDFELDDDSLDGLETVAREEYQRALAKTAKTNRQDIVASTEPQDSQNPQA